MKLVEILRADGAPPPLARYEERVALYRPDEIRDFLRSAELVPEVEWGDYEAGAFDPPSSPRHVLVSRKVAA